MGNMLWNRRKPSWPIDPLKVQLGSVVDSHGHNLSRTHVRVKHHRESQAQFVPLVTFIQRCQEALRESRPLRIDELRVAPILKQRHAAFFDRLTDWRPAVQMVRRARLGSQHSDLERDL